MILLKNLMRTLVRGRRAAPAAPVSPSGAAARAYELLSAGDLEAAAAVIAPFVAAVPVSAEILLVRGMIHEKRGEARDAEAAFRACVARRPDFAAGWMRLALNVMAAGIPEDAVGAFERAAACDPESAQAQENLGFALFLLRDLTRSIAALERALALEPARVEARLTLAIALLAAGDLARGWEEYEHRFATAKLIRPLALQRWSPPAEVDHLAVVGEQGLGDTVLMGRFVPRLRQYAQSVTLFVLPQLVALMEDARLADRVLPLAALGTAQAAEYGAYLPSMSLPFALGAGAECLDSAPYLRTDDGRLEAWRARLGARDGRLRVGLAWGGSHTHALDRYRSIPAERLAPLGAVEGIAWYRLQIGRADLGIPAFPMADHTAHLGDLAEIAALMNELDLVICVDTGVAHLAGALGRPVWVMATFHPDWHWEIAGRPSPWYSNARVFRPPRTADWTSVIEQVATALRSRTTGT